MLEHIHLNEFSKTPKYKQIINSILANIENHNLKKGDKLPSINEVSFEYYLSRDTVEKAYRILKQKGVVESVAGKGFFIADVNYKTKLKIFLLFNKLSAHKKIIYDSFVQSLGEDAFIDFFIYHNSFKIFKDYILQSIDKYSHYVIISHFLEGGQQAAEIINQIPKQKLFILDKQIEGIKGTYPAIYQNFQKDIYQTLHKATPYLKKYQKINLIFPEDSYHPKEIIKGFRDFCQENNLAYEILTQVNSDLNTSEVYIVLQETDLVNITKLVRKQNLKIGDSVGIISYNETPLKEVLLEGITVMSTDFQKMGETAAQMIKNESKVQIENDFHLIIRNSL